MITIVDYGMGNLGAVFNMLRRIGTDAEITSDPGRVRDAEKLILPGVGAFDHAVTNLAQRGLTSALDESVTQRRTPVLGICLGMQLLGRDSEEGPGNGFGWIDAHTIRFKLSEGVDLKVPHMGWRNVQPRNETELFSKLESLARFYFVHSYHVVCARPEDVLATTTYGLEVTAAVHHGNVWGVQFHPEKSHRFGMQLLRNFVALPGRTMNSAVSSV